MVPNWLKILLIVVAALSSYTLTASAEFIVTVVPNVTQYDEDSWRFEYTIASRSTGIEAIYRFSFTVGEDSNLSSIEGPSGWDIFYDHGTSDVTFFSSSTSVDVLTNDEAIFRFTASLPPNLYPAVIAGEDVGGAPVRAELLLPSLGPRLPVPEPTTWLLGLAGIGVAWVLLRLRG